MQAMPTPDQQAPIPGRVRPRLRFNIRDLLAVMTIVGLSIALLMARSENQTLRQQLEKFRPKPYIPFMLSSPVQMAYGPRFTIRVADQFYPLDYEFESTPRIAWKLISVSSGSIVGQSDGTIDDDTKIYQVAISPNERLAVGFYVIELSILDGDQEVASRWATVRVTE